MAMKSVKLAAAEGTVACDRDNASARRASRRAAELSSPGGAGKLAAFAALPKGSDAPWWLHRGVCANWGFDIFRCRLKLVTVSENATFCVEIDGEAYAMVRVSQPDYAGGSLAIASEVSWVESLRSVPDINVLEPLALATGFHVATILDDAGCEWFCTCSRYIEGSTLEHLDDPSTCYRVLGAYTARLHEHAQSWRPPQGFTRFSWNIPAMVGDHPRWGRWQDALLSEDELFLFSQAQWAAREIVAREGGIADTWGLIHADLRPSNVIKGTDGTLTLIDFDDCGYSWSMFDFAAALSFVEHEPYAPKMAREWVEGYRSVKPLSDRTLAFACALSMLRRLQMVGWTTNHYADALPAGLHAEQVPGTVVCALRFLDDPCWLLA